MALFRATVIIAFVVSTVLMMVSKTDESDAPDVTPMGSACNGRGIDLLSDYARARDIVLDYAVKNTPTSWNFNYYGEGRYMSGVAFSNGRCDVELSKDQCERCMKVAERQVIASCAQNTEGWVRLKNCYISYWEFPIH